VGAISRRPHDRRWAWFFEVVPQIFVITYRQLPAKMGVELARDVV
jgi:hypothetical protein